MKTYIRYIGWVFMLTLAFGAVTLAQGEEIAFNIGAEPISVDPLYAVGRIESHVVTNLYQGLMTWDNGQLTLGVAGKWIISKDGTQYRFQLRNMLWSNGDPVVAKDFEAAWLRVIHPKSSGRFSPLMNVIQGVEEYRKGEIEEKNVGFKALGKNVFWVKLKRPCSQFLSYLTLPSFMPVNARLIQVDKNKTLSGNCTNGPYTVAEWEKRRYLLLESNPRFRGGQPRYSIRLVFMAQDTAAAAFKAGVVQAMKAPEERAVKELTTIGDMRQVPSLNCSFVFFNLQRPPFTRPEIRKAFALVTHKEAIIQKHLMSRALLATSLVPFGIYDPDGKEFCSKVDMAGDALDGEQARRLLWQMGYPGEVEFPPIDLICKEGEENQQTMETLAKMWKINLGVKVEVVPLSWKEYKKRCLEGRYYIAKAGWDGDYPDPMAMLELFRSDSPGNFCQYRSKEYDALLSRADQLQGQERSNLLHVAEKRLMQELAIIPLYFGAETYILSKDIRSLQFTPQGHPMFWTLLVKK